MSKSKENLIRLSSSLLFPRLFSPSPNGALTTILYHDFFGPDESIDIGRIRLRNQLEWLRKNYTPLTVHDATTQMSQGTLPPSPLVVTADDALIDLMDVYDIFQEFEIPLTVFACSGWIDNNEPLNKATLSRISDFIHWYKGDVQHINLGKYGEITLSPNFINKSIDYVISKANQFGEEFVTYVWDVLRSQIVTPPNPSSRKVCTWAELVDLHKQGITIGSHTVTHCRLAQCSPERLEFELSESKQTIESYFPECSLFAYPFGTPDVVNTATSAALEKSGYDCGFLTHADFSPNYSDVFTLPRIVIPNNGIAINEYKARILGGTIPFDTAKKILKSLHNTS